MAQVVDGIQHAAQHFAAFIQMMKIRAREVGAGVAITGRIGALKDNWEAEEFEKEIQPQLDKAGPVDELGPRGAVKLFLALTRCYFYAKYPTSTDPVAKIKIEKDPNVDTMLRQAARELVAYGQSKYPNNQEFDDLITDFEYGYIDDINTESLIVLITEVIAFIS